jgi:pimeloyl-ACP methyl ester carboxylesterase
MFEVLGYHPLWSVHRITAPVLLRMATHDKLCPPDTIRRAAALLGNRTVVLERDVDHLSAHIKGARPETIQPVLEFLARYMQPEAGAGVAAGAEEGGAVEEEDVAFV